MFLILLVAKLMGATGALHKDLVRKVAEILPARYDGCFRNFLSRYLDWR